MRHSFCAFSGHPRFVGLPYKPGMNSLRNEIQKKNKILILNLAKNEQKARME